MAAPKAFETNEQRRKRQLAEFQKQSAERRNAMQQQMTARQNMLQQKAQERSTGTSTTYSWTGKNTNEMNTLEKTAYLRSFGNNDTARAAVSALSREMQTVGSRHYSPYSTGKSNQKEAMAFFGLDSFDQNWLDENRFLLNYTNQLDMTDTISTSGQKNWSKAQWAGYYYSQLAEAEKTTQAAENEWAQLRSDMQRNFNEYKRLYGEAPSYDKLMSYIDMNDYSTLQKMDKVYSNIEDLVRLNRSVEYTPETMVGVYASLLNGKDVTQDGDYFEEAVQYTMKPLQRPQETPEKPDYSGWTNDQIEAKRQEIRRTGSRKDLAQFEVDLYASTPHLDSVDSESYFSDAYYDQAFLDKYAYLGEYAEQLRNRDGKIEKPAASDPWWYGAAYEYDQIRSREEDTRKAEEEWKALRKTLTASYAEGDDVDILLEDMNWDKYPTLKKLREGKEVDLNRPVYFSDEAIKGVLQAHVDGQDTNNDDFDYAFYQAAEKPPVEPEKTEEEKKAEEKQPENPDAYFGGPSAYGGKIEEEMPDINIDSNSTDIPRIRVEPEEPYQFNPDAYFSGPAQTPEAIAADEQQKVEAEQRKEERQSFMDNLWQRMTANTTIDATMIEKQFYEENGRPMTNAERYRSGLEPLHLPDDPVANELERLGIDVEYYEPGASIFDDTYNSIAQRYDYENMDQLIANDPALLSNMIDYVDAKPVNEEFSTTEVEHLKLLKQYQDDLDNGTLDEMFRTYADANATDEAKLNGALQYIIESGLTLEEKGALGLLDNDENTQLVAERADKLFGQHGGEMARAMAISLLGTDADEGALKVVEAAISHLFAVETGVVGGLLSSQMHTFLGPTFTRDVYAAVMIPMYEAKLGEGYTLDQACEIDPLLRSLTAVVDKGNAIIRIASPDMSSFNYGAEFTQFITKSATDQKMAAFYAPVGQNFANSMFKKLGLGDLPEMLAADKKFSKAFELIGKTSNSMPWMLRSMSQSAQQARDMGAGERDAIKFGLFNAGTTGLIEGFIGQQYDGLLGKGSNVLAKGLSKLTKGGMDKFLAKNGVIKTMNVLQQAFSESLEEMAEAPLDKMGRMNILNQTAEEAGGDVKETLDNMKLAFVSSLFTTAFFGLSAEPGTKTYTDSEKLLDRIANGDVTIDELVEFIADEEAARGDFASDREAVLGMAIDQNGEQEGGQSPEYQYPMVVSEDYYDPDKITPPDFRNIELIPGMAKNGYVPDQVRMQFDNAFMLRDSMRIIEETQTAMDEAAIEIVAEDDVQQQIANGALDDINGPASSNMKTIAQLEGDVQASEQKIEEYDSKIEMTDQQKRNALHVMIGNGIPKDRGAAKQAIFNIDEIMSSLASKREAEVAKKIEKMTALQLEQEHIQAQVDQRKKEMKAEAATRRRTELKETRKKVDKAFKERVRKFSVYAKEGPLFTTHKQLEWADNDWGGKNQAISISGDGRYVLIRDPETSELKVARLNRQGKPVRRISLATQAIQEKLSALKESGNQYADHLIKQFESDPVGFVTRMNWLIDQSVQHDADPDKQLVSDAAELRVSNADLLMEQIGKELKAAGHDLGNYQQDEILFEDKKYASEEEAMADRKYRWHTDERREYLPRVHPEVIWGENKVVDTAIDQIVWGDDDGWAPFSAQNKSAPEEVGKTYLRQDLGHRLNYRQSSPSNIPASRIIKVQRDAAGNIIPAANDGDEARRRGVITGGLDDSMPSQTRKRDDGSYSGKHEAISAAEKRGYKAAPDSPNDIAHHEWRDLNGEIDTYDRAEGPLRDSDYSEIPKSDYREYEMMIGALDLEGIRISDEHLRVRYDGHGKNDTISQLTEGHYVTNARSKDGKYLLVVNRAAWEAHWADKDQYARDLAAYSEAKAELKKIKDKRQYEEAEEKLKNFAASMVKPTTPVDGYFILDTSRARPSDRLDTSREIGNDIVRRIDARLTELRARNEELKAQGIDGIDIDQVSERIAALEKIRSMAKRGEARRFIAELISISKRRSENISDVNRVLAAKEAEAILADLPDPSTYDRTAEDTDKRLNEMIVRGRRYSNMNQALAAFEKLTGEPAHKGDKDWKPTTYEDLRSDAIYYASKPLIQALENLNRYYNAEGKIDVDALGKDFPGVVFGKTDNTGDKNAAGDRMNEVYDSKLAADNDRYVAIDQMDGFNLVVAKKDTRLDPAQTGDVRVNPNIYTVSDAKRALQKALDGVLEQMTRQRDLHVDTQEEKKTKKLSEGQRVYYRPMVLYSIRDKNGNLASFGCFEYQDPVTGKKRMPSADDLMAIAERITVNYTDYDQHYEQGVKHYNKVKRTEEVRKEIRPVRSGGQDQYRFTLESVEMAPDAQIHPMNDGVDHGVDAHETPERQVVADLKAADQAYNDFAGRRASIQTKAEYFRKVCEAYYKLYMDEAIKLSERVHEGRTIDAELPAIKQRLTTYRKAMSIWRYIGDRMDESFAQANPNSMKSVMKKYDSLMKESKDVSFKTRMQFTAAMFRTAKTVRLNQLKAQIPEDATVQTLQARYQELEGMLQDIMNARNQAAILNMRMPSAVVNQPLAEAIIEEMDTVQNQLMIIDSEPDFFSSLRQQHSAPQEQAPDTVDDTVEAPASEQAENAAEKPSEELSQNAENEQIEKPEGADTVQKKQEMDRTYLQAMIGSDDDFDAWYDNEELEQHENQAEAAPVVQPEPVSETDLVNMETGESTTVTEVEPAPYPELSAEDLSFATPVEEFMERAGMRRTYPAAYVGSPEQYDEVEEAAETANDVHRMLTDRINAIHTALRSGVIDPEQTEAIKAEMSRYIDERNRIKREWNQMTKVLADSEYIGSKAVRNIAQHCIETGDVDWERSDVRSVNIAEIRKKEIAGIRNRMHERMRGGQLSALTIDDVAYILRTDDLMGTLKQRNQVASEIRRQMQGIAEQVESYEKHAEQLRKQNELEGENAERMTQLAHLDEYLLKARDWLNNGERAMKMYFNSGSKLSLTSILSRADGGKLPLPIMNRLYAMLQDAASRRDGSTNRNALLNASANPLQAVESYVGEYAPIFNAIYIAPVMENNAKQATEMEVIVKELESLGINAQNEEIAFKYAEGKIDEMQFQQLVPDQAERSRIRYGVEAYHQLYERLYNDVNAALKRNGFTPIKHRENYVHHMSDAEGFIAEAFSKLGIHIADDTLPTSLAGRTEELEPRRKHMSAQEERHGDETSYKMRRNTIKYVQDALRVIHHTDDITRLRQLEGYSVEEDDAPGVSAGLRQYGELTKVADAAVDKPSQAYSNFAVWINNYTNNLAGKKSSQLDRWVEEHGGRNVLQIIKGLSRLTGTSATAYNLGVAASNILPIATVSALAPKQTWAALAETVHAFSDHSVLDFEAKSDFLTSRFNGKPMDLTLLDKFIEKGYIATGAVDHFAAHAVVRTFYKIGREKGWTDSQAIKWADQMALRVMGSRTTGEGANILNGTIEGAFLQFSREGISNMQFLIRDLPKFHGGDDKKALGSLLWILLAGFLYNSATNKDTALDVITPTIRSAREWDSEKTFMDNAANTLGNYAESLNPTNIGVGGSYGDGLLETIPAVSAVTDVVDAVRARDGADLMSAALGFVPGGRSYEKLFNGLNDLHRGYAVTKDGKIKYVLNSDEFSAGSVFDVLATISLGSNASMGGRSYKASGYTPMTSTQTAAFHSEKATGMSNQEAYNSVMGHSEQKGNNNASDMVLPDWAAAEADSDWMQAVREFGVGAYPRETPEEMTINGVERKLTDEEKEAFVKRYKQTYRMYIVEAMNDGSNLHNAAESAYNKAYSNFRKGLED